MGDIDTRTLIIVFASLFSAMAGIVCAHRAKKTEQLAMLVISVIFAVLCLVGIILAILSLIFR